MEDFEIVKLLESSESVDDDSPDEVFFEILFFLLVVWYFMVEVAIISELHDNAKWPNLYQRLFPSRKAYL